MNFLYPDITPFNEEYIKVSDLHTIHFEQCGNPNGKPVLFIHGGPGGGIDPFYRRFFNPDVYRVVLVNQRGSGKSTPHAELVDNTTQHLIADFEQIRQQLGIEKWMLFGGSWGSTLSLAYAQAHPDKITQMIIRGVYLATQEENHWLFGGGGANRIFPEFWQPFAALIPKNEQGDMIQAYYQRLTSDDSQIRKQAADAWSGWEVSISKLEHDANTVKAFLQSPSGVSMARLECHYMHHGCFLSPNQLLDNIAKIAHIPCAIVHGRYDMVCTASKAWQLHQAWPESKLQYVTQAGHSMSDPALAKKLLELSDEFSHL